MKRVPVSEVEPGCLFLLDTSWGERLVRHGGKVYMSEDQVWYEDPDTGRVIGRVTVRVEVGIDGS